MATREELVKQRTKWEKEKTDCTNLKSRVSDAKTTVSDFKEELTEAKDFFGAAYKSDTATEMKKSIVEDREIYNQIKKALEIVVTNLTNRINDLTKVIEEAEKILEKGRKAREDFVYTIPTLKETVFKEITLPDVLGKTKPSSGKNPSTPETTPEYKNGDHLKTLPPGLTQRKTKSGKTYWTDKDGNKFIPSDKTFWKKGKDGKKTEVPELPKGLKQKTTKDGLTYFVDEEGNKYVPKDRYYTFKAANGDSTEPPSKSGKKLKDGDLTPSLPPNIHIENSPKGLDYVVDEDGNWYFAEYSWYEYKPKDGGKTELKKTLPKPYNVRTTKRAE